MPFELFVALRYLLARRKQAVISFVTLISIAGVAAGVAALIVALALNTGFQKEFQERILGATSHLNLIRLGGIPIRDYERLADQLAELEGVQSVSPTVYGQAQLVSDLNRQRGVIVRGVDPDRKAILADLFEHVVEGTAQEFHRLTPVPSMIVGKELALELGIMVGDYVKALGMQGELSPLGPVPRVKNFQVIAVFESGLWDYDANWVLVPIKAGQSFLGLDEQEVSALEFKIDNIYSAGELADRITERAGLGYSSQTWIDLNKPLFSALKLEKLALFIAIGLIVFVASLNIVSTLTMMVMEKSRDIAIISAMGGDRRTVMRIFMIQGLIIGIAGTALGNVVGVTAVWYLDTYRVFRLEPQVYSIPYVPFEMALLDIVIISVLAVLISFLATLYPARAAAGLDPVEAFRYE